MKFFPQILRSTLVLAATVAFCRWPPAVSPLRADAAGPAASPKSFGSPEEAVKALVAATAAGDQCDDRRDLWTRREGPPFGDSQTGFHRVRHICRLVAQFSPMVQKNDDRYVLNIGIRTGRFPYRSLKRMVHGFSTPRRAKMKSSTGASAKTSWSPSRLPDLPRRPARIRERGSRRRTACSGSRKSSGAHRARKTASIGRPRRTRTRARLARSSPRSTPRVIGGKTAEGQPQPFHGYLSRS